MESGIIGTSWPWKIFPKWVDNNAVIGQAIQDIIFTTMGERKMSPDHGSQVMTSLFENKGGMMESLLYRTISLALAVNLPVVKVLNIDVSDGDEDTEPVTVIVDYMYMGMSGNIATEISRN